MTACLHLYGDYYEKNYCFIILFTNMIPEVTLSENSDNLSESIVIDQIGV